MSDAWAEPGRLRPTHASARLRSASDGARGSTVAQRQRADFDAFVRARLSGLLRLGRALTGGEEAAADLVQDALERTLMHWTRLGQQDATEAYVLGSW